MTAKRKYECNKFMILLLDDCENELSKIAQRKAVLKLSKMNIFTN
jgi:hypothetical protein